MAAGDRRLDHDECQRAAATPAMAASGRRPRSARTRARPRPAVASITPGQSKRWPVSARARLRDSQQRIASTTPASGRLMKKTQRHDRCSTSQPPSTGPNAAVIAVKPDQVPMARPRCGRANEALISARLPGTSSAAPTPCSARAAISSRDRARQAAPRRGRGEEEHARPRTPCAARARRQASRRPAAAPPASARRPRRPTAPAPASAPKRRLQRRQRDVHDRAVDEGQARAEDGRGQHPAPMSRRRGRYGVGPHGRFVARGSGDHDVVKTGATAPRRRCRGPPALAIALRYIEA